MAVSYTHLDVYKRQNQDYVGTIVSLRGLTVEIQIIGTKPANKELLSVQGHPEVFLEVNFFRGDRAICLNLNNSSNVACGQTIMRTHQKVSVPVGEATMGRVFNALGEPLDKGPCLLYTSRCV